MKKKSGSWLTLPDDTLGLIAVILIAIGLNFALEYLTGIDSGMLGESMSPVHYTRTNVQQHSSGSEQRDRADRDNESLLAALSIP